MTHQTGDQRQGARQEDRRDKRTGAAHTQVLLTINKVQSPAGSGDSHQELLKAPFTVGLVWAHPD